VPELIANSYKMDSDIGYEVVRYITQGSPWLWYELNIKKFLKEIFVGYGSTKTSMSPVGAYQANQLIPVHSKALVWRLG